MIHPIIKLKRRIAFSVKPLSLKTKRVLLICLALSAYIAWSFGVWEEFLIVGGLRPRLRPDLLLTGDSLTAKGTDPKTIGWVALLQDNYQRSVNVVPRGLSGYNTRWYLKYAMPVLRGEILSGSYTPVLITLWLGANDAVLPAGSNAEQHVPIELYRQNLIEIVKQFQILAPNARILLITPPHIDDDVRARHAMNRQGDKMGLVDRTNEMAGKYAAKCVETARELGLPVIDLYSYCNDMPKWKRNSLLVDGIHLNRRGNKVMYEQLLDKIKTELPDVARRLERWQLPSSSKLVESDPWVLDETSNSTRSLRDGES